MEDNLKMINQFEIEDGTGFRTDKNKKVFVYETK